jgi:diguanylate cyclase (GGDEF)-like protein
MALPLHQALKAMKQALRETSAELLHVQAALRDSLAREAQAQQLAWHDPLTGLPNRRGFEERSGDTLARHQSGSKDFALLFIDLDDFKLVNDHHGHAVGDELLRVIGQRLVHALRAGDMVSRQGGDEFLCLLPDVRDAEQVAAIARKLFDSVAAPCQLGGVALQVKPSIGVALYPRDGDNIAALIAQADGAMFHAKRRRIGHAFTNGENAPAH